jgi:hypothetical protein
VVLWLGLVADVPGRVGESGLCVLTSVHGNTVYLFKSAWD